MSRTPFQFALTAFTSAATPDCQRLVNTTLDALCPAGDRDRDGEDMRVSHLRTACRKWEAERAVLGSFFPAVGVHAL